jgi:ADP-ribosylglycohydrolase
MVMFRFQTFFFFLDSHFFLSRFNRLTSFDPILFLPNLQYLDISGNEMCELHITAEMLPALSHFHFAHCAHLKDIVLSDEFTSHCQRIVSDTMCKVPSLSHNLPSPDLTSRKWGSLLGHAIGDALCLCSEFQDKIHMAIAYGAGFCFLSDPQPPFLSNEELKQLAKTIECRRRDWGGVLDWVDSGNAACFSPSPSQFGISLKSFNASPYHYFLRDNHRIRWLPADHSDDTDQMILIGLSSFDPIIFGYKLLSWSQYGFSILGDQGGLGIGSTVMKVLKHPKFASALTEKSKEALFCAAQIVMEASNGQAAANGALMRTSVIGVCFSSDLDLAEQLAIDFCRVTHADVRCIASCVVLVRAIGLLIQGRSDYETIADEAIHRGLHHLKGTDYIDDFMFHVNAKSLSDLHLSDRLKIGYTFKALGCALFLLRSNLTYTDAILALAREAGDADTNAACAGPLLGAKFGLEGIPRSWIIPHPHLFWFCQKIEEIFQNGEKFMASVSHSSKEL